MKLNRIRLILRSSRLIFLLGILLQTSCKTKRTVTLLIFGANDRLVEMYNGEKMIINDTMKPRVSSLSLKKIVQYNFRDSLFIKIYDSEGQRFSQNIKLRKCKFIYFKNYGLEYKVYGSNKLEYGH